MGKSTTNTLAEQEFTKLQAQLHQSAQDALSYLEALKHKLGEYDHKHHLHLSSSATSFFDDGLDHAKGAVKELKHAADHIHKNAGANEVNVARRSMEQAFNALADLHKVANAYDKILGSVIFVSKTMQSGNERIPKPECRSVGIDLAAVETGAYQKPQQDGDSKGGTWWLNISCDAASKLRSLVGCTVTAAFLPLFDLATKQFLP